MSNFACMSGCFGDILKKSNNFDWNQECDDAFEAIKEAISNSPTLGSFDHKRRTIITTDASKKGLGATLSQIHEGMEVIVASRCLTPAESKLFSSGEESPCLLLGNTTF